ncbi:endonuclease/exonuclease/phosphatase family protein [Virgibacillus halodenitrificans]|uniref:endonuclease/exonuclease/phosphatase family protein n=1 Tax=Virgibacillus halodenitrificans TaxID=1482 RepID=UPI00045C40BE|nr:endonuclease/exonuclease/phosphatase family protein [Virgibacillus halodenitrificans]CDQ31341.1 exodeoxyribonuclease III (xth) [Virgibacillus halodenitrificans]
MSYNIHHGVGMDGNLDIERIATIIKEAEADIVGLQEVDKHFGGRSNYQDQVGQLAEILGYYFSYAANVVFTPEEGRTENRQYGTAILSKYPLIETENVELKSFENEQRSIQYAKVNIQGEYLHLFNTHLGLHRMERLTQVKEISQYINSFEEPKIFMGDFNAEPNSQEMKKLLSESRLVDRFTEERNGNTFPSNAPKVRIDYILTSPSLKLHSQEVLDTQATDHLPIICVINIENRQSKSSVERHHFALEELRRLLVKIGKKCDVRFNPSCLLDKEGKRIFLMLESEYNESSFGKEKLALKYDGFAIIRDGNTVWIVGKEDRSILYGVYHYCEEQYGYLWVDFKEETKQLDNSSAIQTSISIHEPDFFRRGNIIETINDPIYVNQLIDWGVKNKLNEFFFTFFLWDEIRPYIIEKLTNRNLHVTLGGHSLAFLVKSVSTDVPNDKTENIGFFASDQVLQEQVISKIIEICKTDSIISRISLWPEDIGVSDSKFMPTYIRFMERLKERIAAQKIAIEVEHIVYNAGLSWNMLERSIETTASSKLDVLYAYWGRNYSKPINYESTEQSKALAALLDWRKKTEEQDKTITVLEYYSDHFMLSELFPPLINRISEDLKDYKEKRVDGILNLIVPYHAKDSKADMTKNYPWKWIQLMNNYFYAGSSWGTDFGKLVSTFYQAIGKDGNSYGNLLNELEKLLSKHTGWNVPLFPARVVDPEKVNESTDPQEIIDYLGHVLTYFSKQKLEFDPSILKLQHENNFMSFSNEEMLLSYLYYITQTLKTIKHNWSEKRV